MVSKVSCFEISFGNLIHEFENLDLSLTVSFFLATAQREAVHPGCDLRTAVAKMGKTQPSKWKPRKTVNLPPKKSNAKKSSVQRVYAMRPRPSASQPIEGGQNQQATSSTSNSLESSTSNSPGSSNGETDASSKEDGVHEASKQSKKKTSKRASLLSRIRNCYNVSLNSTAALSNLSQEDIAFLFEKSDHTLENDLDFCEFKLNELNERRDEIATRALYGSLSDSPADSNCESKCDHSPVAN